MKEAPMEKSLRNICFYTLYFTQQDRPTSTLRNLSEAAGVRLRLIRGRIGTNQASYCVSIIGFPRNVSEFLDLARAHGFTAERPLLEVKKHE
jgi:hypothetical protein